MKKNKVLVFGFFRDWGSREKAEIEKSPLFFLRVWNEQSEKKGKELEFFISQQSEEWLQNFWSCLSPKVIFSYEKILSQDLSSAFSEDLKGWEGIFPSLSPFLWKEIKKVLSQRDFARLALNPKAKSLQKFAREEWDRLGERGLLKESKKFKF